jgi:hypothetical protein
MREDTLRTRAGRIALLALFAFPLAAPAAVLGEQLAPPRWHLVVKGNSPPIPIMGEPVTGLYPGATKDLILTLRNPNRKHSVGIRRLRVREVATSSQGCAPSPRNLEIRQYPGRPFRIAAHGTKSVTLLLTMPDTVVDACQHATFRLRFSAEVAR